MLIVAARARDGSHYTAERAETNGKTIVCICERLGGRSRHRYHCRVSASAVLVVWSAADYDCLRSNRVVIQIVSSHGSVVSQKRGSVAADDRKSLHCLPFHHRDFGQIAVLAAQAEQNDGVRVLSAWDRSRRRERNREASAITKFRRLATQRS